MTGPDEYNVLVDNNVYTNLMARVNMQTAITALEWMEKNHPKKYQQLCGIIALERAELAAWHIACDNLYVPYDSETKIYPQDDGFLRRKPLPIDSIPNNNFPLLLHYHPLVIYRHQICKQADLILAMVMLGDQFSIEEKKANFAFYDSVTTHDSSLSMTVFSILASEIGEHDTAYQYFSATTRLDLDNMHHNTKDGLHMANMAGTWLCLTQGFGGMRMKNGVLSFAPYLPTGWRRYSFRVRFQSRTIEVSVCASGIRYELLQGEPLRIIADGNDMILTIS